jgi:predicted murein hydrolase (TIGR00659 family)
MESNTAAWLNSPLFGIALTVGIYAAALQVQLRYRRVHPLFLASAAIIAILLLADIPYEIYNEGGKVVSFFLGPATIALGVPLYKQRHVIRERIAAIIGAITVGCAASILGGGLLVTLSGGTRDVLLATLPKSATSAFAVEIAKLLSASPELTAVFTVLTGLFGSMFGPSVLRLFRVKDSIPLGIAIGTAAHGIGTSRLLRDDEIAGAYSGLAMGIAGIVTAILMTPVAWLLSR